MTEYEQEEPLSILAAIVCITREKNKSKALLYVFQNVLTNHITCVSISPGYCASLKFVNKQSTF